jgi:hypothetical protein
VLPLVLNLIDSAHPHRDERTLTYSQYHLENGKRKLAERRPIAVGIGIAPSAICIHTKGGRLKKARSEEQQVIDAIRDEWQSYSKKHAAIDKRRKRVQMPNERWLTLIRCACCEGLFPREGWIEANHINPVGKLLSTKPEDIAAYRQRMFCKTAEIEPLCKPCHHSKTAMQRQQAKELEKCLSVPDTSQ